MLERLKSLFHRRNDDLGTELLDYCDSTSQPALGLASLIGCRAYKQTEEICGSVEYDVFAQLFSYFLGKACWIGTCHNKLVEDCYFEAFGRLNQLDVNRFSSGSVARYVAEHLRHYFHVVEAG